jgi:hypothetical protein
LRKKFNTNPQLRVNGNFYPTSAEKDWWLGESFEQELRDNGLADGTTLVGVIGGVQLSGSTDYQGPANMIGQASRELLVGLLGKMMAPRTHFMHRMPQNSSVSVAAAMAHG